MFTHRSLRPLTNRAVPLSDTPLSPADAWPDPCGKEIPARLRERACSGILLLGASIQPWIWLASLLLLSPTLCHAESDVAMDAAALIGEAHKVDSMYCNSEQEDREKAIATYEAALKAQPDKAQTLEILYRMAQLHQTNYQIPKGEKPHYDQAMRLYHRIIAEYPPDEPLVIKSLICAGDVCVTTRQFADALRWFCRALDVNVNDLLEQQKAIGDSPEHHAEYERIERKIKEIQFYQSGAVTAISSTVGYIDPSMRKDLLESIVSRHPGVHVRDAVTAAWARKGSAKLFPLPANIEDMNSSNEPPVAAKEPGPSVPHAPDAPPLVAAMPKTPASYQVIAVALVGIALVVGIGVLVVRRKIGNQWNRKAS